MKTKPNQREPKDTKNGHRCEKVLFGPPHLGVKGGKRREMKAKEIKLDSKRNEKEENLTQQRTKGNQRIPKMTSL